MGWIEKIAERRAAQAVARGELQGLAGEGRPLDPERLRETTEDVLHRLMADAGALPAEFVLRKQIDAARAALPAEAETRRACPHRGAGIALQYRPRRAAALYARLSRPLPDTGSLR